MSYGELSNTQETMVLPMLQIKNIRGKPYIEVSSKGIVNGLSNIPNDGADFGPDTTKGATAPGQYGAPYTETSGIQEAINIYTQITTGIVSPQAIYLLGGAIFVINASINFPGQNTSGDTTQPPDIVGAGRQGTVLQINKGSGFVIPTDANGDFNFRHLDIFSNSTSALSGITFLPTSLNNSRVRLEHVFFGNGVTGGFPDGFLNIQNCQYVGLLDVSFNDSGFAQFNGVVRLDITQLLGNAAYLQINASTISGVTCYARISQATLDYISGNVNYLHMDSSDVADTFQLTGTVGAWTFVGCDLNMPNSATSFFNVGAYVINALTIIGTELQCANGTSLIGATSGYVVAKTFKGLYGNIQNIVFPSNAPGISTNPPVSGTVYQNTNNTDIRLKIPVTYSPTSTAAATLATGTSSTSTVTTSTKVSYPAGITTGIINTYEMVVPAGQYFELVVTNATIGTVEVQEA